MNKSQIKELKYLQVHPCTQADQGGPVHTQKGYPGVMMNITYIPHLLYPDMCIYTSQIQIYSKTPTEKLPCKTT